MIGVNIKKELEKWKIKEPRQEDIQFTLEQCKKYLNNNHKYEVSKINQFITILKYSEKRWFLLEIILCIFSIFVTQTAIHNDKLYFLSFTSILFAGLMLITWFRNLNYNVWELENVCRLTSKQVLLYKMIFMSSINLFVLFLLSIYATIMSNHAFITVFFYGAFPFFLAISFTLDFNIRFKNSFLFMAGFLTSNLLSYMVCSYLLENPKQGIELIIITISFLYGIFMSKRYIKVMEQEGGGLLWN